MTSAPDEIVDVPGYADRCATFREASFDAERFAQEFGCDAWVVRFSPDCDDIWKVRAPARAVAVFTERQRQRRRAEELAASEREVDAEEERQAEAWIERYGTPWSAP